MGVKSCMLVYLLICTVRLASACTSICQKKLVDACSNLQSDQPRISQGALSSLCFDNIYTMVDTLMQRARKLSESDVHVEYHHVVISNKIRAICNSSLDNCKDFDVIGYTAIKSRGPSSESIKVSLLPVSKPCSNNPWVFNLALELHLILGDYEKWILGRCVWSSSDTSGLDLALLWTSQIVQPTTITKPLITSITSSRVTSPTKTSMSSSSVTSPTVTLMSGDAITGPNATAKATNGVSSPSVAAIACGAFIMGILCSLCVLLILRLKRQNKMCFKVAEEPSPGKWEGASKQVTTKVIAKHLKTKTTKDQYEEIEKKVSKAAVTPDQPYDNTLDHPRDSHVYSVLTENKTDRNEAHVEKKENSTSHVYLDLSQNNLFESGRESSDSYFPNAAFRNSNFAADENDIEKRDKYVNTRVGFNDDNHSPTNGSVTQEEEHVGGGPQQTKGDAKENTSNSETASTNNHESAYFILEKGSSEPKEPKEDHTYFKLEVR